jgi:hypothetical protein
MITTRTLRDFTIETAGTDVPAEPAREWLVRRLFAMAVAWVVVIVPVADVVASHR